MEHVVSEIIKIFTTMLFILLIVGMVIMGKHLSDVNTFKEYVNTQIERKIHSNITIPFATSGTIRIPIAFKGQAISRIRNV